MRYFIAVVPPEQCREKINEFHESWKGLKIGVEPHITVKAQGGLTDDLEWLGKVKDACSNFTSFTVALQGVQCFGNEVLFLGVDSENIIKLHHKLMAAVEPSKKLTEQYFEGPSYHPHLTIGQQSWWLFEEDMKKMKEKAEEELVSFSPFTVEYIRVYKKNSIHTYEKFIDIPLGNQKEDNSL